MKAPTRNALRQLRHQAGSLIGIITIVAIAVGFYVTMKTSADNYNTSTLQYFETNAFPDAILSGSDFTGSDAEKVAKNDTVESAQIRTVIDTKHGDDTLRLYTYDIQSPKVNIPYVYEGSAPRNPGECLITQKYAQAHDIKIGDTVKISTQQFADTCLLSGLASSPEHLYLMKNPTTPIADVNDFGILYADTVFASRNHIPFNEIVVRFRASADRKAALDSITAAIPATKLFKATDRDSIFSYEAYKADVGQFKMFAYIFPIVFFIITAIVIFVSQRRNVLRDRRQIGILKALGCSNGQVTRLYGIYAVIVASIGSCFGIILSQLAGPLIIATFNDMLTAPYFSFDKSYANWAFPVLSAILLCLLATIIAIRKVVLIQPAEAMHAETPPKGGRDIWLQKTPIWRKLSFNTRYAIKAALRNRGRFVAMICGMIAMLALTVMSLGFQDSFNAVTTNYFDDVATYDILIQTKLTPFENKPQFDDAIRITSYETALMLPSTVTAGSESEDVALSVSNEPLKMYNLTNDSGDPIQYDDGVVLPWYYAEKLKVKKGDTVHVSTPNQMIRGDVKVSDVSDQSMGMSIIVTYSTAKEHLLLATPYYNTTLVRTSGDMSSVVRILEKQDNTISVSSRVDDKESFARMSSIFGMYIILLVGFSIVLGIATLYSISSIAILSRQYEFIVLRVMGYARSDILSAYAKELLIQFLIAMPIGIMAGYAITHVLARSFSIDSYAMKAQIHPITYVYATLILLIVLLFTLMIAGKQIGKQRLVEGLKSREE